MGISDILYTGRQALLAQRKAIQVVGQNIANVNTPGYSRERPVFVAAQPASNGTGFRSGVTVDQVQRVYDQFVAAQVNVASTNFQSAQEQADLLGQVEALFNDLSLEETGLSNALESLFQGFQDLASNPQGLPERGAVQQQGIAVANALNQLHQGLRDLGRDLNTALQDELAQVNSLTSQIAGLNDKVQLVELDAKTSANTFRDERDLLVKQLAEKVEITTFETSHGQVTVLLRGGRPIVEGVRSQTLVTRINPDDTDQLFVDLQDAQGNTTDVTSRISGGKIHGLLEVRDTFIPLFTTSLNRLAAQLTSSINQVHSHGFGLDGTTGTPFFVQRQVTGQVLAENQGDGTLQSLTVFDPTQLTLDEYRIKFVTNTTFDIVNTTTGTTVSTGQTYTSGASIRFAGMEVVIANGSSAPQTGDTFLISTTKDAAKDIAVDSSILNDPKKIAAAGTPTTGDNTNALALAELRQANVIDGTSLGEFYGSLVSSVGLESQNISSLAAQRQLVLTQVENRREALAGVSLDEEEIDLIRFQQAFGAAANFIRIADELAQTVVDLLR